MVDREALGRLSPLCVAACLAGCSAFPSDPVREDAIAALGPETSGVPAGPLHRPGQPCGACHADGGRASAFSFSGTVYRSKDAPDGFGGAEVVIIDSENHSFVARTNCAGNFFVRPEEFQPVFPVWTTVRFGSASTDMESMIHREGSCAACHTDPATPQSAGHVFVTDDPLVKLSPTPCPKGATQ